VLCNHNLWINSKLSAELTYPLRWNQTLPPNRMRVGSISPSCTPWRYQFTKFSLISTSVL
jgi:hypothetical protein